MLFITSFIAVILSATTTTTTTAAPTFKHPAPFDFISDVKITLPDHASTAIQKRNVGGVRLSNGVNFTGNVWYGIYPLNQCIGLGDYTDNVLSFRPDEGNECLLMQGQCDAEEDYADLYYNSTDVGDLSGYEFVKELTSYMCFAQIE